MDPSSHDNDPAITIIILRTTIVLTFWVSVNSTVLVLKKSTVKTVELLKKLLNKKTRLRDENLTIFRGKSGIIKFQNGKLTSEFIKNCFTR